MPRKQSEPTTAAPTCPACQSPMVLRTARKCPNAGNQFWGCSGFPGCKKVLSVNSNLEVK